MTFSKYFANIRELLLGRCLIFRESTHHIVPIRSQSKRITNLLYNLREN